MAVPARLRYALHQKLGDDAAHELVKCMEHVDSTRTELRDINELNFARIDSRFAEERHVTEAAFSLVDNRFGEMRQEMQAGFAAVDVRFLEFRQEMQLGFARMETRFAELDGKFETKLERRFGDLLKWSFLFWCGAVGAIAALARVLR
jgi:hypothetical protein